MTTPLELEDEELELDDEVLAVDDAPLELLDDEVALLLDEVLLLLAEDVLEEDDPALELEPCVPASVANVLHKPSWHTPPGPSGTRQSKSVTHSAPQTPLRQTSPASPQSELSWHT
jgi:hypothetical protein